jgi:hypothetical protein
MYGFLDWASKSGLGKYQGDEGASSAVMFLVEFAGETALSRELTSDVSF